MHDKNKEMLKIIGSNFRNYRVARGYTRDKAARELGVSPRTLAAYERGEREITAALTVKLAELYGTTFKNLIKYR